MSTFEVYQFTEIKYTNLHYTTGHRLDARSKLELKRADPTKKVGPTLYFTKHFQQLGSERLKCLID